MPKAVLYCRVSSDKQVREGHGLDGQEIRCRRYAEERGYEIAATFRDEGVSGGVIDREGMQGLLDYLDREGGGCVVVIDDIKRLARDLIGHFTLRKAIQSRGARLESPSHKFGEEPEEIFVESIFAATAELERNQNRRQVRNRMQARLEAGYWPFYPPPGYAFDKVPGHGKLLVPREPEAGIIRQALEGFADGRFPTQTDVYRFLRSRNFRPRRQRGQAISYLEEVKRLLTREVYSGIIHYPPWNVARRQGHHRPLISPQTHQRILDRLREQANAPRRSDNHRDFPLRGFVLCAACRKPYTGSWSKGRNREFAYYRCNCAGCPAYNKSVRADRMHAEFESILGKLRPRQAILAAVRDELLAGWERRMLDVDTVRRARQEKLDAIQKEIDGYLDAVARCHNPTVLKKIEEEVEALEARRLRLGGRIERARQYDFETALDLVLDFLKDPSAMWRTDDLEQKRLVLRLVFQQPLAYRRQEGFETPSFSLPVALACVLELDELEMVEMLRRSWNRLQGVVCEWAEMIRGLAEANNGHRASAHSEQHS